MTSTSPAANSSSSSAVGVQDSMARHVATRPSPSATSCTWSVGTRPGASRARAKLPRHQCSLHFSKKTTTSPTLMNSLPSSSGTHGLVATPSATTGAAVRLSTACETGNSARSSVRSLRALHHDSLSFL
eukprot:Amastigsp_a2642_3.p4 type:complete len:129 gc:universal Amastigsp_a2642_3:422-808(+)